MALPLLANRTPLVARERLVPTPQTGALSLRNWLEFDWFYPPGFEKEFVAETDRFYFAFGKNLIYKFLKHEPHLFGHDPKIVRRRLWRQAYEEYWDSKELGAGIYLGVSVLAWFDGEPQWLTEVPIIPESGRRAPLAVDEIALVMRRVPKRNLLPEKIARSQDPHLLLTRFSEQFLSFQRRQNPVEGAGKSPTALWFLPLLDEMRDFVRFSSSFLDPYSRVAFLEVFRFVFGFYERNQDVLAARVRSGMVIDGHGALAGNRIAVERNATGQYDILFFGRSARKAALRVADVLSDIARLYVDLSANGQVFAATELEAHYRTHAPDWYDASIFRFLVVLHAAAIARKHFSAAHDESISRGEKYLAVGLCHAINLQSNFLAVIVGNPTTAAMNAARSVRELVSCELITPDTGRERTANLWKTRDQAFEKILWRVDEALTMKKNVALVLPTINSEERMFIQRCVSARSVHHVQIEQNSDALPLPKAEFALYILREVAHRGISHHNHRLSHCLY